MARARKSPLQKALADGRFATALLFLPPALTLFTFFVVLPIFEAGTYAGYKWSGYGEPTEWVGSRNFEILSGHSVFHTALLNTIKIIAVSAFIQVPLAMGLALLIYRKSWANTIFRLIFFVPFIMAEVATGLIWSFVFDGDYGIASMAAELLDTQAVYPQIGRAHV